MATDQSKAITARVERIRRGSDPQCIARLPSGWAILAKFQPDGIVGGCMLLPDPVVPHLEDLAADQRRQFMDDVAVLGAAVRRVTNADRINYLILCNQVPELHAHCVPRFVHEDPKLGLLGPFEAYDFGTARLADGEGVDAQLIADLRAELTVLE